MLNLWFPGWTKSCCGFVYWYLLPDFLVLHWGSSVMFVSILFMVSSIVSFFSIWFIIYGWGLNESIWAFLQDLLLFLVFFSIDNLILRNTRRSPDPQYAGADIKILDLEVTNSTWKTFEWRTIPKEMDTGIRFINNQK